MSHTSDFVQLLAAVANDLDAHGWKPLPVSCRMTGLWVLSWTAVWAVVVFGAAVLLVGVLL